MREYKVLAALFTVNAALVIILSCMWFDCLVHRLRGTKIQIILPLTAPARRAAEE
jgi:hypothetical protein